jgi:hypothetical protein
VSARTRGYGLDFAQAVTNSDDFDSLLAYYSQKGWPTNAEIREILPLFRFYRRERDKCQLVLQEVERSFGSKELVNFDDPDQRITIEHVLPQTLTKEWSEMLGENDKELHERYADTIGNLTLTGYNPELSNRNFVQKKEVLAQSHLALNGYFSDFDKWTVEEIRQRTGWLADRFLAIWWRPED